MKNSPYFFAEKFCTFIFYIYICSELKKHIDMIEKERLMTIRNYAEMKGVTVSTVYLWEKKNRINIELMDGIKFVVLTDEEIKQRKEGK